MARQWEIQKDVRDTVSSYHDAAEEVRLFLSCALFALACKRCTPLDNSFISQICKQHSPSIV